MDTGSFDKARATCMDSAGRCGRAFGHGLGWMLLVWLADRFGWLPGGLPGWFYVWWRNILLIYLLGALLSLMLAYVCFRLDRKRSGGEATTASIVDAETGGEWYVWVGLDSDMARMLPDVARRLTTAQPKDTVLRILEDNHAPSDGFRQLVDKRCLVRVDHATPERFTNLIVRTTVELGEDKAGRPMAGSLPIGEGMRDLLEAGEDGVTVGQALETIPDRTDVTEEFPTVILTLARQGALRVDHEDDFDPYDE